MTLDNHFGQTAFLKYGFRILVFILLIGTLSAEEKTTSAVAGARLTLTWTLASNVSGPNSGSVRTEQQKSTNVRYSFPRNAKQSAFVDFREYTPTQSRARTPQPKAVLQTTTYIAD